VKVRFISRSKFEVNIDVRNDASSEEIYNEVVKNLAEAELVDIDDDVDIEWRTID